MLSLAPSWWYPLQRPAFTMEPDRRHPDDPIQAEEYGALLLREGDETVGRRRSRGLTHE